MRMHHRLFFSSRVYTCGSTPDSSSLSPPPTSTDICAFICVKHTTRHHPKNRVRRLCTSPHIATPPQTTHDTAPQRTAPQRSFTTRHSIATHIATHTAHPIFGNTPSYPRSPRGTNKGQHSKAPRAQCTVHRPVHHRPTPRMQTRHGSARARVTPFLVLIHEGAHRSERCCRPSR